MTPEQINKTIHEARGFCWHSFKPYGSPPLQCEKCKEFTSHHAAPDNYPSYTSSWADWGKALEWAQEKDWWREYLIWRGFFNIDSLNVGKINTLLNPLRGATALAEFIQLKAVVVAQTRKDTEAP